MKHLAVLRAHGIVNNRRDGNVVYYTLLTPCVIWPSSHVNCETQDERKNETGTDLGSICCLLVFAHGERSVLERHPRESVAREVVRAGARPTLPHTRVLYCRSHQCASIHKRGAGLGPATVFLYSGPAINVLAILLTARILGSNLNIARAAGAILFAVVIGLLSTIAGMTFGAFF
jgi:DNA-binding transcriptional ArsR family regulator